MTVTQNQLLDEKEFKCTQSLFKTQTPTVFAEVSKIQMLENLKVQHKEIRLYSFFYFELISTLRKWIQQEEIAEYSLQFNRLPRLKETTPLVDLYISALLKWPHFKPFFPPSFIFAFHLNYALNILRSLFPQRCARTQKLHTISQFS